MGKITSYASLAAAAAGDVLPIVDISDTSMAASGTTKQITMANLQSYIASSGMQYLTGGGTITSTTISNAISASYVGIYLDPRNVWDMSGLSFNGIQNFTIESRMNGSIGWTGGIQVPAGFVQTGTGSPVNGIQVYASTPSGATATQGVIFRNVVFQGSNSHATIHYGGGQRRCGLVDCLVYNTSSAAGAYGVCVDSAISDNNSENNIFTFTGGGGIAGNYGALGLGIYDQTQHANDTLWNGLSTAAGVRSIDHAAGGGHLFTMFYDRSNPSGTCVNSTGGGRLIFHGTEFQNNTGTSLNISGGNIILNSCTITQSGSPTTTIVQTGGTLTFRDFVNFNSAQTMTLNGGTADFQDGSLQCSNLTITGTSGTLALRATYPGAASPPVHTGFTPTASTTF